MIHHLQKQYYQKTRKDNKLYKITEKDSARNISNNATANLKSISRQFFKRHEDLLFLKTVFEPKVGIGKAEQCQTEPRKDNLLVYISSEPMSSQQRCIDFIQIYGIESFHGSKDQHLVIQ